MKGERGASLLLLSDGHANEGITDHTKLERAATATHGHGVTSGRSRPRLVDDREGIEAYSETSSAKAPRRGRPPT